MANNDLESRFTLTSHSPSKTTSFGDRKPSSAPFTTEVFGQSEDFNSLLPATHRTEEDNIVSPESLEVGFLTFLQNELLVDKIENAMKWLWACGRPMPPRPLHYQVLRGREITITEDAILHLVWGNKRIFIKPLPKFLLHAKFWEDHILDNQSEEKQKVAMCARGFLFSYCALIAYESDYRIAKEKGLIPDELTWDKWKSLSAEVLCRHEFRDVHPRYCYGELRLSRLNKVYRFAYLDLFRGFSRATGHDRYIDLLSDNLATLTAILGYVVIVITAMQLGLATEKLTASSAFQDVSYGFTIFSIVAPLISVGLISLYICFNMIFNYNATTNYEGKRFKKMGVEVTWRRPSKRQSAKPSGTPGESA